MVLVKEVVFVVVTGRSDVEAVMSAVVVVGAMVVVDWWWWR